MQALVIAVLAVAGVQGEASCVGSMRLRGGAPAKAKKPQTRAEWIKMCEGMKVADGDFLSAGLKFAGLTIAKQQEMQEAAKKKKK